MSPTRPAHRECEGGAQARLFAGRPEKGHHTSPSAKLAKGVIKWLLVFTPYLNMMLGASTSKHRTTPAAKTVCVLNTSGVLCVVAVAWNRLSHISPD